MNLKTSWLALLLMIAFGSAGAIDTISGQRWDLLSTEPSHQSLNLAAAPISASNCPSGCESCWEQCTTSSDCGVGHKCIATACGNRCVKE